MIDITKACPGCGRKALDRFGFHLFHCAKTFSPPLLKENVVRALEAPLRAADMRVCEREPRMSDYFDAVQQRTQTESQEVEDGDITTGVDSRADIIFKGAERARHPSQE
jgi:hypothetical protein